ncbi:MAG: hypothetical protein V4636_12425 [Pseudomonadota bacterium]
MPPYPGLVGPSYRGAGHMAARERLINLYIEKNETPNAPTSYCLLPTPGFTAVVTVAEGPIRGTGTAGTRTFFVAGFALYELNSDDTATLRGTLAADANPATLCWNGPAGDQLFITSGDLGYILDIASNVLSTVLLSGAAMGSFLDGFFLALDAATGTLQISDLLDGLVWDPSQIAQRTQGADPWVCLTVIHTEIWLMGSLTSEVWQNVGAFPFPFAPIQGAFLEQGIAAPFSATRDVAPLLWVNQNVQGARMILIAEGYDGRRISTHGVEAPIGTYDEADVAAAQSMGFQIGGHTFYAVTFPDAGTWLYDVTEGAWSEWLFWNHATSTWEPARVMHHLYVGGRHLVGDTATGTIHEMSLTVYTDVDGEILLRERMPPRVSDDQKWISIPEIQLVCDVGVGLSGSGPNADPQAMLQTSRDAGRTWGTERWASLGPIGAYNTRVRWLRCGQARNRQDRFRFSAAVPFRVSDAVVVNPQVGTS